MCVTHAPIGKGVSESRRPVASAPTSIKRGQDPLSLSDSRAPLPAAPTPKAEPSTPPKLGKGIEEKSRPAASVPTSIPPQTSTTSSSAVSAPTQKKLPAPPPQKAKASTPPPTASRSTGQRPPTKISAPESSEVKPRVTARVSSWFSSLRKDPVVPVAAPKALAPSVSVEDQRRAAQLEVLKAKLADGKQKHDAVCGAKKEVKQQAVINALVDIAGHIAEMSETYAAKLGNVSLNAIENGTYRAEMCHKVRGILDQMKIPLQGRPDFLKS